MFANNNINASHLSPKTLCFTFDDGPGETDGDGPGPKTLRLAKYLAEENIYATFFTTGKHLAAHPHIAPQVLALGHTIGNHTYNHPDFTKPETFVHGETMVSEIENTQQLINKVYNNKNIYFRAPYGTWSAEIAKELNEKLSDDINYIGPIGWDINENDWHFWLNNKSPEECAVAYFEGIEKAGKGIVVMHDSTTDIEAIKLNNRTFEMVQLLVPKLKQEGYTFVRLEDVVTG